MRILQITDTHLYGDPAARHYDRIDTGAALTGLLDRLGALEAVDAVVHTGDASEDGSEESYRRLHAILDPVAERLGAALAITMGNHDVSAAYAAVRGPGARGTDSQDRVHELAGGGRVVVLDSSLPGAGYGQLEDAQLAWLADVLAEPAAAGTVLALHHPPLVAATPMLRTLDLDRLEELAAVLAGSDVRIVLAGHYHHEMSGSIGGVPVHVAPGVTNVVDPVGAGEHERSHALSGASVVEIGEGAPRVFTSVLPSTGDTLADPLRPVYDFGPAEVRAIAEAAGR